MQRKSKPHGRDRCRAAIPGSDEVARIALGPHLRLLVDDLAALVAARNRDDLVFTTAAGAPLRNRSARRDRVDAAEAIGQAWLTPHGLRQTAASLAVGAGANVKAVQRMLGQASAALTLDRYADLLDDDLDAVVDRLDAVARGAREHLADNLRTDGRNVYPVSQEETAVGQ